MKHTLAMIFVSLVHFTPVVCAGDWPMFQHYAAHTCATDDVVPSPLGVAVGDTVRLERASIMF